MPFPALFKLEIALLPMAFSMWEEKRLLNKTAEGEH